MATPGREPGPEEQAVKRGPYDPNDRRYQRLKETQVDKFANDVPVEYRKLVEPHIASFNYFLGEGLQHVLETLKPVEMNDTKFGRTIEMRWTDVRVEKPAMEDAMAELKQHRAGRVRKVLPRDCREGGTTYKGSLVATFKWRDVDTDNEYSLEKRLGGLPIMVGSRACWLSELDRPELVRAREEANEVGGYFVCNGIERIIRCLVLQRRHYIMALRRGAYHKRGANYTDAATLIRCVRPDQSSSTVRCHYLKDGTVNFAFTFRRQEYFIPAGILLKCFLEVTDRELYAKLVAGAAPGSGAAAFLAERAELLLRQANKPDLMTRTQCVEYLGERFRIILNEPTSATNFEVGEALLRDYVFFHLTPERPADKLNLLLAMLHKLFALVSGAAAEDNPDALTHHEILLPGHLLLKFLKEKLEDTLNVTKGLIMREIRDRPEKVQLDSETYMSKLLAKLPDVGAKFEYLLNTGNLISNSGLDLSQATGFTIVAEKLNFFRYLSHFRSVHRGAYFAELRTTTVRKLLPESWGFMCPVHTPDGAPCGLLNHFTAACDIVTVENPEGLDTGDLVPQLLVSLGMLPATPALTPPPPPDYLPVMLDGRLVGHVRSGQPAADMVARVRRVKALALEAHEKGVEPVTLGLYTIEQAVPYHMEVVHIPPLVGGPYPGIFLFTQTARMIRPVVQLATGKREMLGSLEQCFMAIQCPDGGFGGSPGLAYTHRELSAGSMLSVVASMTPYSDYNQSPRNMYQCQMAKQTMGTPGQALPHRTDTKMYRLQTPQSPICRTIKYAEYNMDEYPNGTNAIVAVLAYTGYDMEDAMILNKSAMERGLAHASLYKTETIDLRDERGTRSVFAAEPLDQRAQAALTQRKRPVGAFGQRYPLNVPASAKSPSVQPPKPQATVAAAAAATSTAAGANKAEKAPAGTAGADGDNMEGEEAVGGGGLEGGLEGGDGTAAVPSSSTPRFVLIPEPAIKEGERIEPDGLPAVGAIIWPGQAYAVTRDENTGRYKYHKLKGEEVAVVDQVTMVGTSSLKGGANPSGPQRVNIRLRFNRNPMIGDKFASRHGQKGVMSILWPDTDMPFCAATGIRPDLIINPHAFPSRMTIGMLVESLVSKGGALAGQVADASPFQRSDGVEKGSPVERWGEYLERQGFSRYGQETMISGVTGQEMPCDIYIGPVYYQRLRHMVSDKFQVRSTGPINTLTRQPIKGRKFGGGIRFGEMERDSLLAHGAAYLLHDRLHACSDYHVADVCTACGSLLAPLRKPPAVTDVTSKLMLGGGASAQGGKTVCPQCAPDSSSTIERVALPYVFRYLATELAAMNIKMELEVK